MPHWHRVQAGLTWGGRLPGGMADNPGQIPHTDHLTDHLHVFSSHHPVLHLVKLP